MPIVEVKNLFKYYAKPENPKEKFAAVVPAQARPVGYLPFRF